MYETKISTARWIMYGIPGNIGWLLYLVGRGRLFSHHGFLALIWLVGALVAAGLVVLLAKVI